MAEIKEIKILLKQVVCLQFSYHIDLAGEVSQYEAVLLSWPGHNRQVEDRARLSQAFIKNIERQEKKKIENRYKLKQQVLAK